MKRIAFLLLASSMSVSVFAGPESWSFVQSVGGITVEAPSLLKGGWVLPVRADVSGFHAVTVKATALNSALVCITTDVAVEGRNMYLTIVTATAQSSSALGYPNATSRCPSLGFGEMLPGKYGVFYRGPGETPMPLGEMSFGEDGPVDTANVAKVIGRVDKIVVFETQSPESKVLFSSTAVKDIAEFNDALSVALPPPPPKDGVPCACAPFPDGPAVRLYSGGTELVLVTNLNKNPVGSSRWSDHAVLILIDREKWLRWFDARHIPAPLNQQDAYEAARARSERGDEAH